MFERESSLNQWWTGILTKFFTCSGATHVLEVITIQNIFLADSKREEIDTPSISYFLHAINYVVHKKREKRFKFILMMMMTRWWQCHVQSSEREA